MSSPMSSSERSVFREPTVPDFSAWAFRALRPVAGVLALASMRSIAASPFSHSPLSSREYALESLRIALDL